MKSAISVRFVTLVLAVSVTLQLRGTTGIETTTVFSLDQRFTPAYKSCVTKSGQQGKCVDNSYCNNDHEIEEGGIIDDSELRSLECNYGDWCCSDKNVTIPPKPKTDDTPPKCTVSNRPDCPWCVKLYRDGNDMRIDPSGFFCMGTLISSRVILTSGTCMIQSRKNKLWAQIPSLPSPTKNFTVKYRLLHNKYNSGTRENDLALLTLDREIEWDNSGSKGACLDLDENALQGDCIGTGIDDSENIDVTPLLVAKGNCGRGAATDAACGHAFGDDCSIVSGAPIMCRANKGPFIVTGLVKLPCSDDPPKALLNNLVYASHWLTTHLKETMGLSEKDYLRLGV